MNEEFKKTATALYGTCLSLTGDDKPLTGTGAGVVYDAMLLFGDKLDAPAAAVFFEQDALENYLLFTLGEGEEITEQGVLELANTVSETGCSIGDILQQ